MSNNAVRKIWSATIQDWGNIKLGFKTSVPPGTLLCLIVSDVWLNHFKTAAYLAPVIAACALPTLPRAKLLRFHCQLAFLFVISYAYVLLAGWSGLKARHHTETTASVPDTYNASASAVVAIFFIFYFYMVFAVKAAYPAWQLPSVLAGLYTAAVLPPLAASASMSDIIDSASALVEACLIGLAVALVIGLVLFPQTCRRSFFNNTNVAIKSIVSLVKWHSELLGEATRLEGEEYVSSREGALVEKMKQSMNSYLSAASQAAGDHGLAKQEFGFLEKVNNRGIDELHRHTSGLIPLLSGIVSTAEMLLTARARELRQPEEKSMAGPNDKSLLGSSRTPWSQMCHDIQKHSKQLVDICSQVAVELQKDLERLTNDRQLFLKKSKTDEEAKEAKSEFDALQDHRRASDGHFSDNEELVQRFMEGRSKIKQLDPAEQHSTAVNYFMVINEQSVLQQTASGLEDFSKFALQLNEQPKRFVLPCFLSGSTMLGEKWHSNTKSSSSSSFQSISSTGFRIFHNLFCSQHAGFGLRGACAMMSIAIIAFLRSSGTFYAEQRFLWALYAILLSLNETSGSSTQSLVFRFGGTFASMVASYLAWYIPDQKAPGILVLTWIWFATLGYLYAKFPRIQGSWFVALIAAIVMVGNELQVRELGDVAVEKASQAVYPPYVLFPYRLAVVTLGIVAAYIWTLVPVPSTEHRELRSCLARSTMSLARLHLAVRETVQNCFFGHENSDVAAERDYSSQLIRARSVHFSEYQQASNAAKALLKFLDWEFLDRNLISTTAAQEILASTERIANQMNLVASVSTSISNLRRPPGTQQEDIGNERLLTPHLSPAGITSRLMDLSNALARGSVLSPDLADSPIPDIVEFLELECSSNDYSAAAALVHAANWYMIQDLSALTKTIAKTVGTLEYSV